MKGVRQGHVDTQGIPQPCAPDNPGGGGVGGQETAVQPSGVGSQEVVAVSRECSRRPRRQGRRGPGSHRKSARGIMIQMLRLDPSQAWIYHSVTVAWRQGSEGLLVRSQRRGGRPSEDEGEGSHRPRQGDGKVPQPTKGMVVVRGQEGMAH